MIKDITIDFKVLELGYLGGRDASLLSSDEIEYYSYEGNVNLRTSGGELMIIDVPIINFFQSILTCLNIVPVWKDEASFSHYFRDATTGIRLVDRDLNIFHREVKPLQNRAGNSEVSSDLIAFSLELRRSIKEFVGFVSHNSPSFPELVVNDPDLWPKFPIIALERSYAGFSGNADPRFRPPGQA